MSLMNKKIEPILDKLIECLKESTPLIIPEIKDDIKEGLYTSWIVDNEVVYLKLKIIPLSKGLANPILLDKAIRKEVEKEEDV